MKFTIIKMTLLLIALVAFEAAAQYSDPNLRRIGYHTGNRVGISFYNDGQIAGFNQGVDIRGEWPLGSGENYIGDCIPLIGAEFVTTRGDTIHSVVISRGPRSGQGQERHPEFGYFWGWNPIPGFINPNSQQVAMSHLPETWPIGGWFDDPATEANEGMWIDEEGHTQWNGYFGRGIINADQESFYWADDHWDDEFNAFFTPDETRPDRKGMALQMKVRGFQWASFLAEDAVFWLYDIKNDGTYTYRKTAFGTVVGTLAGGDGDSSDDLGSFDVDNTITYSWDADGSGNRGQEVGYVGYAYLESPGNPFDGIDNDNDSVDPNSPDFVVADFEGRTLNQGDEIILINPDTYERTIATVGAGTNTYSSLGVEFVIEAGVTTLREGWIASRPNGIANPHKSAYDGIDNDLDGLIDENEAIHLEARTLKGEPGVSYVNYYTGEGAQDLLIDERRDNDAGIQVSAWVEVTQGNPQQTVIWSGDENGNWAAQFDDVGSDGLGPEDDGYPGPDPDGTEGNGMPDDGEPNFGKTDPDESDQIGLTSFNFFNINAAPNLSEDETLWDRMRPGRFDIIPPQPQDGDFIYASGYFPLPPDITERFSVSLLFGEDLRDIISNKDIVQQIYNSGYQFPKPPPAPEISITQEDGNVVIYWDNEPVENSRDFITKTNDFQGYKIYRSTDAGFIDSRTVTNAFGVLAFDEPLMQMDIVDTVQGFFYPGPDLLSKVGGVTYYLGANTGVTNKFVDSTVVLGQTYYYAVCAYDHGAEDRDIFPSENAKRIFITNTGEKITEKNTAFITPGRRGAGYVSANLDTLMKSENFVGTGYAGIEIVDQSMIEGGETYEISFTDTSLQRYTESWSLTKLSTGEVLAEDIKIFNGNTPVIEGFRPQLYNDSVIKKDTLTTGWSSEPSAELGEISIAPWFWNANSWQNGIRMPYDYDITFYDSNIGESVVDSLGTTTSPRVTVLPSRPINFEVKNLTTGEDVDVVYFTNQGSLSTTYNFYFKENVQGEVVRTWRVTMFYNEPDQPLETSGTYSLRTEKPFVDTDKFTFTMNAAAFDNELTKADMDKINVVPNPYVVTHEAEARLLSTQTSGRGEREIRFTHIPPGSKIQIFTVRGELIKELYQEEMFTGNVFWNLRTEENLEAAFGVYVFVVEVPEAGKKIGKFALIK